MAKNYFSATQINAANYCTMKYYLVYTLHKKPLRLSSYVRGSLLHDLINHFWDRMGTPEQVSKKSSGKKYFDAESFARYAQGKWKRIIIADKHAESKITWAYKEQPWAILGLLPKVNVPLFNLLFEQGRPLFSELPFDFLVDGKRIVGRIDEIRMENRQIILRDYKSGRPWLGDMKLKYDPQLTIYNVALCSLCLSDKGIANALGLEGKLDEFMAGQRFTSPNIEEEFFMIDALGIDKEKVKTAPPPINKTRRKDEHFLEVLKMIEGVQISINGGNVYPERGRKCDDCDVKHECDKELENVDRGILKDKGQIFFSFVSPSYIRKKEEQKEPPPVQKKFRFRYKRNETKT